MVILNIILGLIGLGLVIFIHELGHFIAAKSCGITVEAFSIGWGKALVSRSYRGTEYRLSVFPVGGYCKMKGEESLKRALDNDDKVYDEDAGSLFSVSPWKRVVTYLAGPAANALFATLVLSVIWFAGFSINTFENRILLLSETALAELSEYPADIAGLETGDRIVEIDGRRVQSFRDIENHITPAGGRQLSMVVERDGRRITTSVTPELDRETGAGKIGVAAWIEPVIAAVSEETADASGLRRGDRLLEANDVQIRSTIDLYTVLASTPETLSFVVERGGSQIPVELPVTYGENGAAGLGFSFEHITVREVERNPFKAIARGAAETIETLKLTVGSIGLLFRGVNVRSAVSGPIRITYLVGEVASAGFSFGLRQGLITIFRFLSLLSVAICFMNLLPIPALDGGMILITLIEMALRRPIRPKFFYRYQIVGFLIIMGILILTTFNDVFLLARG